jgi:hypothetical protein
MCEPCNSLKKDLLPGEDVSERVRAVREEGSKSFNHVIDWRRMTSLDWWRRCLKFVIKHRKMPIAPYRWVPKTSYTEESK